jgi:hypothetical protein
MNSISMIFEFEPVRIRRILIKYGKFVNPGPGAALGTWYSVFVLAHGSMPGLDSFATLGFPPEDWFLPPGAHSPSSVFHRFSVRFSVRRFTLIDSVSRRWIGPALIRVSVLLAGLSAGLSFSPGC